MGWVICEESMLESRFADAVGANDMGAGADFGRDAGDAATCAGAVDAPAASSVQV